MLPGPSEYVLGPGNRARLRWDVQFVPDRWFVPDLLFSQIYFYYNVLVPFTIENHNFLNKTLWMRQFTHEIYLASVKFGRVKSVLFKKKVWIFYCKRYYLEVVVKVDLAQK